MTDKKINATEGRESIAGERFKEMRDIINENSVYPFKDIIGNIAGISPGGYYNYTSENSDKFGRVSLYTVKNLSTFFNLHQGIFDCTLPFDEHAKEQIAQIIRDKFGSHKQTFTDEKINTNNLISQLKELSYELSSEGNIDILETSLTILESTTNILKDKIKILKL